MPEGVVRIADGVDADGIHGVGDVQQDSVAGTGARRQAQGRIDRDVVALVGAGRGLRAFPVVAAFPEAVHGAGLRIGKDARAGDDLRQLRVRQRHLDDVDPEQRGVRIRLRVPARASRQFFRLTNVSRPGDVDVDVVLVLRVDHERMRVRAAAALHGGDLLRIREVADIEDADAAEPVRAGRRRRTPHACGLGSVGAGGRRGRRWRRHVTGRQRYSLRAAVDASIDRLGRHEEQMAVHRDVALAARAHQRVRSLILHRVVDVVEIDAVVVARQTDGCR